jgi:hypothetical protein
MAMLLAGVILGAACSWFITWKYYRKSTKDTDRLKWLGQLTIDLIENKGVATLNRDASGNITGLNYSLSVADSTMAMSSGEATLVVEAGPGSPGPEK